MPMITIEYDDVKLSDGEIRSLCVSIQKIVAEVTAIKDVFVYANSSRIKIQAAPIEVFVSMSAHLVSQNDLLLTNIKAKLVSWKRETGFMQPINLTLIPMQWKFEVGI